MSSSTVKIRLRIGCCVVTAVAAISTTTGRSAIDTTTGEWPYYGGTAGFARYSPENLITPDNVKDLKIVWERPAVEPALIEKFSEVGAGSPYFKSTPIMIGGVLYASNGIGLVEAFDAATGRTRWIQEPFDATPQEIRGNSARGVAYWKGDNGDERIFATRNGFLYALHAASGKVVEGFGDRGRVGLARGAGGTSTGGGGPTVIRDVIVVGGAGGGRRGGDMGDQMESVPESILAFDARSGGKLWEFSPMPLPEDPMRKTWSADSAAWPARWVLTA